MYHSESLCIYCCLLSPQSVSQLLLYKCISTLELKAFWRITIIEVFLFLHSFISLISFISVYIWTNVLIDVYTTCDVLEFRLSRSNIYPTLGSPGSALWYHHLKQCRIYFPMNLKKRTKWTTCIHEEIRRLFSGRICCKFVSIFTFLCFWIQPSGQTW